MGRASQISARSSVTLRWLVCGWVFCWSWCSVWRKAPYPNNLPGVVHQPIQRLQPTPYAAIYQDFAFAVLPSALRGLQTTRLRSRRAGPEYLPATPEQPPQHRIIFAHDYFSQCLAFEVAPLLLAGSERRLLPDFG